MSKYTTQVRFICETASGLSESAGFSDVNSIIEKAIPKVFNFDFPIYDENYRNVLCVKILKHYYTREICAETVGLWKLWLDARLNEIMPYYNELYKSALIEFNPMYDIELSTTHKRTNDGTSEGENHSTQNLSNTGSSKNKDKFSDTPQGGLDNVDNDTYLTSARIVDNIFENKNENISDDTSKNTVKNTEDYIQKIVGKTGGASYSTRLKEFRSTFINIDRMIIDELSDLFFNLW